ncbi:hypothetical protein GCM10028790_59980 [Micromonospora taraxaci]
MAGLSFEEAEEGQWHAHARRLHRGYTSRIYPQGIVARLLVRGAMAGSVRQGAGYGIAGGGGNEPGSDAAQHVGDREEPVAAPDES